MSSNLFSFASGTVPTVVLAQGTTVTIAGTDTAGLITIATIGPLTVGLLATIKPQIPENVTPAAILLTPASADAVGFGYVSGVSFSAWSISANAAGKAGTTLAWYYRRCS